MHKLSLALSLLLLLAAALPAFADGVTITVTPFLAANNFGSPSATQLNQNAAVALYNGLTTYGAPGPTKFNAQSNITAVQGIVTNFSSWMGVAEPGGAYANELGNRLTFGVSIRGNGTQFSLAQLTFAASSTDDTPGSFDGVAHPAGYFQYGQNSYGGATGMSDYIGVLAGFDGIVGTSDDVYVTSGLNTQMVDAVFGSGSGASFAAYCFGGCTQQQEQAAIADAASTTYSPYTVTGTYTLGAASGSGTFNVGGASTPEPSSLILLGTGVLGMAGAVRRRYLAR